MTPNDKILIRFRKKFSIVQSNREDACWVWSAAINKGGKPVFWIDGKLKHAKKVAYTLFHQTEIGKTRKFISICGTDNCIRPSHNLPDTIRNKFITNVNTNGQYVDRLGSNCWEWKGAVTKDGYGQLSHNNKNIRAHRVAMIVFVSTIPVGAYVCHHCDNKKCVNPKHLYFGTQKSNSQDAVDRKRYKIRRGEDSELSRLKTKDIVDIRKLAADGITQVDIAKQYNIDQSHVSKIVSKQRWSHIK